MKKLFTLISLSLLGAGAFAQSSFQIISPHGNSDVSNSTIDLWGDPSEEFEYELNVKNTAAAMKTVKLKRTFVSGMNLTLPDQDTLAICWDLCLPATWNTTQTAGKVNINAGATASYSSNGIGFHSLFSPCGLLGVRSVRYTFWDFNNSNDSVNVTINYHVTAVGINDNNAKQFTFSNPQPNPAYGSTTIKYDFPFAAKAKIKVYNAVGTMVKEMKIEDESGKITLSTEELTNGIYFYSLIVNDKIIGTKRLIVAQ